MFDKETEKKEIPRDGAEGEEIPTDELSQLRTKLDEVMRAYSRLIQDKDDFLRRTEREKERVLEIERSKIALLLANTVDQLELSLAASDEEQEGLAAGVRLIRDGLQKQIEQSGLVRMDTRGATFDPTLHEAVETVPVPTEALDEQVLSEHRAGYLRGERVVRPARVSVGKFAPGGNN